MVFDGREPLCDSEVKEIFYCRAIFQFWEW